MDWITYQDPTGFALDHPAGWQVKAQPDRAFTIHSPDGLSFVLFQFLDARSGNDPVAVIARGQFAGASFFPGAQPAQVQPVPNNSAMGTMVFGAAGGPRNRARLSCAFNHAGGFLNACAAPEALFDQLDPILTRILTSFRAAGAPTGGPPPLGPRPPVGAPAAPQTARFTTFTDPQMGTFTTEIPEGWQVRGGLAHPQPGDRRPWLHARGGMIFLFAGDPEFPQSYCHFPGNSEGVPIPMVAGGTHVNLKPGAERIADLYLRHIAPRRLGAIGGLQRRPRPDVVAFVLDLCRRQGIQVSRKFQFTAVETLFSLRHEGMELSGSILATSGFTGDYMMGMWTFWEGNVHVVIAPPGQLELADRIRLHQIQSYRPTPRMAQLVAQDEAIITAGGQAANARQWDWFAGQQRAHQAQNAVGDLLVSNYWDQQRANDAMYHDRQRAQDVNDRLSQDRSDAMLGNQRLADDGMGRQYDVPAGHDYYWLDQQTGQVIGTDTSTPPDYSRNYTPLRKM